MTTTLVSDYTRKAAHNLDDLLERWKFRKETSDVVPLSEVEQVKEYKPVRKFATPGQINKRLAEMTVEELENLRTELDVNNANIKNQIELWHLEDHYRRDVEYVREAFRLQKYYATMLQALQVVYGKRRREQRITYRHFSDFFMDAAKRILPKETVDQICNLAKEMRGPKV